MTPKQKARKRIDEQLCKTAWAVQSAAETDSPENSHRHRQTSSEKKPEGRWRSFDYEEIAKRDKVKDANLVVIELKRTEDGGHMASAHGFGLDWIGASRAEDRAPAGEHRASGGRGEAAERD
jgi:hypothetical protein